MCSLTIAMQQGDACILEIVRQAQCEEYVDRVECNTLSVYSAGTEVVNLMDFLYIMCTAWGIIHFNAQ